MNDHVLNQTVQKIQSGQSAKVYGPGIIEINCPENRTDKSWISQRDENGRSYEMRVDRPKSSKGCLYTFNRLHSHFDKFGPPNLVELTLRLSPRLKRPSTIVLQTNVQFNSNRHFLNGPSNLRTVHFNSFKSFGILDVHRCLILKPKRVIPVAH